MATPDKERLKLEHTFLDFAKNCKWDEVKFLLEATPDLVNAHPAARWSALQHAAQGGNSDIVRYLLEHRADVGVRTPDGRSVLGLCSHDAVRLLLSEEMGPSRSKLEHIFLDFAKKRQWDEVKRMVRETPDLVNSHPAGRWSALLQAAGAGNAEVVAVLIANGADVNLRTPCGKAPLEIASNDAVKREIEIRLAALETEKRPGLAVKRSTSLLEIVDSDEEASKGTARREDATTSGGLEDYGFRAAKRPRRAGSRDFSAALGTSPSSGSKLEATGSTSSGSKLEATGAAVGSTSGSGLSEPAKPAKVAMPSITTPSAITCAKGSYKVSTSRGSILSGSYTFNASTRQLCDHTDACVGTFLDGQAASGPFGESSLQDPWKGSAEAIECVRVVSSEIIAEIQNPDNSGAFFVLPSQLNGAEYPSDSAVVSQINAYKHDNTGGPRGQLAVHPAAGQFMLDNAACDSRPSGFNAMDLLLPALKDRATSTAAKSYNMHVRNGYLALPDCAPELQAEVLQGFRSTLHMIRCLGMQDVPAIGLRGDFAAASEATHSVSLFYASAVPVQAYLNSGKKDRAFQEEIGRLAIAAQYYGALRVAAATAEARSCRSRVFLMPLGGGVFNNRISVIAGAVSTAIEMLHNEGIDVRGALDICLLAFKGKPSEGTEMASLMRKLRKERLPDARGPPLPPPAEKPSPSPPRLPRRH